MSANGDTPADGDTPIEIRIEDLHTSFDGHKVLQGVTLDILRGDVVAIVGGSGCGKTVLLNHILGQLVPDAGRVLVTNYEYPDAPLVDIAELRPAARDGVHIHWGVVFQGNALFSGSVHDNIALWLSEVRNLNEDEIDPIARSVLKLVGLSSDDEFLGRDVNQLSGGMAKRLAVARALSMDPKVLFYDEPTTGLDPSSAGHIHDLIHATHGNHQAAPQSPPPSGRDHCDRTTVIITHDKDLLSRLRPRIVMLHDGRVFFDGTLEAFEASSSPIIRPYFDLMPILHQHPV